MLVQRTRQLTVPETRVFGGMSAYVFAVTPVCSSVQSVCDASLYCSSYFFCGMPFSLSYVHSNLMVSQLPAYVFFGFTVVTVILSFGLKPLMQ